MSTEAAPPSAPDGAAEATRPWWPVLLPIVVGVVLRAVLVVQFPDMPLHGDERGFFRAGQEVVAGEEVGIFPYRPPGYVVVTALCALVAGDDDATPAVQAHPLAERQVHVYRQVARLRRRGTVRGVRRFGIHLRPMRHGGIARVPG